MQVFEKTYDPFTGLWTTLGHQDGKLVIKTEGDATESLDYTNDLRNADEYSQEGIKRNWWHCFHIPPIVAMKMIADDGFDPYSASTEDTFKFLSRNKAKYGSCFTTRGQF